MLTKLKLSNFKSARRVDLYLGRLTVLAGLNGSGKSSVLQSLALLRQSFLRDPALSRLFLRGNLVNLGRAEDIHFEGATEDLVQIGLEDELANAEFSAIVESDQDSLRLKVIPEQDLQLLRRNLESFQFIQADRITPSSLYLQADTEDRELSWLGVRGEFVVDFLSRHGDDLVPPRRHFSRYAIGVSEALYNAVAPTAAMNDQLSGWLQCLSPGVKLSSSRIDIADVVTLAFSYTGVGLDSASRRHRPANVGFGLTYCLPVVVACLSAPSGALLLLENPEAHLHPQGQAALGRLLAQCAADGVQIVVETHSDHVLNGIRVAVKNKLVEADNVALHYFTRNPETGETTIDSPQLLPDGQLMDWPLGFFDQWDRSLDELLI